MAKSRKPTPKSSSSTGSTSSARYGAIRPDWPTLKEYASGILVGLGFGLALQKSGVFHPDAIKGQLLLRSFLMMKMFLTATASSILAIASLVTLGLVKRESETIAIGRSRWLSGYEGNVLGGLILGAGMSLSGACPGTLTPQLAVGIPSGIYSFLGLSVGALSFGFIHTYINRFIEFVKILPESSLDKVLNVPLVPLSLAFSSALYGIVAALEFYRPWQVDASAIVASSALNGNHFSLTSQVWPPILAGVVIGLSQIPSFLLGGAPLGTSSSYVTVASQLCCLVDRNVRSNVPYFKDFMNRSNIFQVGIVSGMFLGAYLSSQATGVVYLPQSPLSPATAFLGGLLLMYGARIGAGCPGGHGISGIGVLSTASIISTLSMFAGAFTQTFVSYLLS